MSRDREGGGARLRSGVQLLASARMVSDLRLSLVCYTE
jgi:hypothetical protein